MTIGRGIFGIKQLENGGGLNDITDNMNVGVRSNRFFYTAVVIDFISNPESDLSVIPQNEEQDEPTEENPVPPPIKNYRLSLKAGKNKVVNSAYVDKMPRNSIVAKIVSDGAGRQSMPEIFYPFFSPHLSLPLKPGEQVWVFYEQVGRFKKRGQTIGYWMSRKASDLQVDDLNYTHQDRVTLSLPTHGIGTSAMANQEEQEEADVNAYSFPLGGRRSRDSNTMPGTSPYLSIINNSHSYISSFIPEPVPRYSKKSADFVIQGSNNTLISLGEDYGLDSSGDVIGNRAESEDMEGKLQFSDASESTGRGTIDLVAGRGVRLSSGNTIFDKNPTEPGDSDLLFPEGSPSEEDSVWSTDPAGVPIGIAKNTREYMEVDKTPSISGISENSNASEGIPDFVHDLSRIYISMKTDGDENFGLGWAYSGQVDESPYIIAKSDEIRLVGRGSVRAKSLAGAQLELMSSGEASLVGDRVFLGATPDYDHGDEGHYHAIVAEKLLEAVETFCTNLALDFSTSVCPPGSPIVLTSFAIPETGTLDTFKSDVKKAFSDDVHLT